MWIKPLPSLTPLPNALKTIKDYRRTGRMQTTMDVIDLSDVMRGQELPALPSGWSRAIPVVEDWRGRATFDLDRAVFLPWDNALNFDGMYRVDTFKGFLAGNTSLHFLANARHETEGVMLVRRDQELPCMYFEQETDAIVAKMILLDAMSNGKIDSRHRYRYVDKANT